MVQKQFYIYDRFFSEINTRLRDLEEKQRLLRDKMLLVIKGLVNEREKTFTEIQELKSDVAMILDDHNAHTHGKEKQPINIGCFIESLLS